MQQIIIGFCGLAGSGKSTAALHLVEKRGFARVRFAGPLKAMLRSLGLTDDELDGSLKEKPCDRLCGRTPREAMQWLGAEWGRDLIHRDLWLELWRREAIGRPRVACDDVRYPNEAALIRSMGGRIIRIVRPGAPGSGVPVHSSETQAVQGDTVIENDRGIEDLLQEVDKVVDLHQTASRGF